MACPVKEDCGSEAFDFSHNLFSMFDTIKLSIIPIVALPALILTAWGTLVCVFYLVPGVNFLFGAIPTQNPTVLISILSIVIGLLLVFRTNTAYERYWMGRTLWSSVITNSRNLARLIWVNVKSTTESETIEKKAAINLIFAYAVAIKHHLREEYLSTYEDLAPFISYLPSYGDGTKIGNEKNLPLEISFHLMSFIHKISQNQVDPPNLTQLLNMLNSLVDSFTQFERIRYTPIPAAYSIHLKQASLQVLIIGSIFIPFRTAISNGYHCKGLLSINAKWFTIPIMLIAGFTLLGIEAIENPFGYDAADLPLDDYVDTLKKELEVILGRKPKDVDPAYWFDPETKSGVLEIEISPDDTQVTILSK